jgi:hypothetical protein
MAEKDKRVKGRKKIQLTTFVRKELPAGGFSLMQFISRDLSEGGIYISTDDLSLFDLGEEISIIVDQNREQLFEGQAVVVRSARIFESTEAITESGFGLMFKGDNPAFTAMVTDQLSKAPEV